MYATPAMRGESRVEMPLMLGQTEKDVRDLFSAADTQVDGRGAMAASALLQWEDVGVAAPAPLDGPPCQYLRAHAQVPRSPPGEVTAEEGAGR